MSGEVKHTPPSLDWVSVPSHIAEGPAEVRHKDGWLVCEVPSDEYSRLITAAPELVAMVRELLSVHEALHNHPTHAAARRLLAKAEGRS